MMNGEGQDSKTVYSFNQIDFCSKYISFASLDFLSTQTFVLLPLKHCFDDIQNGSSFYNIHPRIKCLR